MRILKGFCEKPNNMGRINPKKLYWKTIRNTFDRSTKFFNNKSYSVKNLYKKRKKNRKKLKKIKSK